MTSCQGGPSIPDKQLLEAFTESLRCACLKFIGFRDSITVNGFLAINVDQAGPQNFLIAEQISKGKPDEGKSFPVKDSSGSRVFSTPTFISNNHRDRLSPYANNDHKKASQSQFNKGRKNQGGHPRQCGNRRNGNRNGFNKRKEDKASAKPWQVFPKRRNDQCNLTFTIDSARSKAGFLEASVSPLTKEAVRSFSFSTVNLSPSRSMLLRKQNPHTATVSSSNSSNRSKRSGGNKDDTFIAPKANSDTRPRKRAYESSVDIELDSASDCDFVSFSNNCSPNTSFHDLDRGHFPLKDDTECSIDPKTYLKDVELEDTGYQSSPKSNTLIDTLPNLDSLNEKLCPLLDDSDVECSITSVRPKYLVNHMDDVITITPNALGNNQINIFMGQSVESGEQKETVLSMKSSQQTASDCKAHWSSGTTISSAAATASSYESSVDSIIKEQTFTKLQHRNVRVVKTSSSSFPKQEDIGIPVAVNTEEKSNSFFSARGRVHSTSSVPFGFNTGLPQENTNHSKTRAHQQTPGKNVNWAPVAENEFAENYEIHTTKRRTKLMKLMKYFKKNTDFA